MPTSKLKFFMLFQTPFHMETKEDVPALAEEGATKQSTGKAKGL